MSKAQERRDYYRRAEIIKYIEYLTPQEIQDLQKDLDEIEKEENLELKSEKSKALVNKMQTIYTERNKNLCETCRKVNNCKRNKTKVKQCKLFEERTEE